MGFLGTVAAVTCGDLLFVLILYYLVKNEIAKNQEAFNKVKDCIVNVKNFKKIHVDTGKFSIDLEF